MTKNSQPFEKNVRKPQEDFFDSHCTWIVCCEAIRSAILATSWSQH